MFENDIHLNSTMTEIVDVYTPDERIISRGELKIRPKKSPVIEFSDPFLRIEENSKVFHALSHDGTRYILIDCEIYAANTIYPKVIIKSDTHDGNFRSFCFVIQGLTKWFDNSKFTKSNDNYITKYLNTNKFSSYLSDNSLGRIKISSNNWSQTKTHKNELFTLKQKTAITVEAVDACFSCDQVRLYINKITQLLSILAGYPLNVEYCYHQNDKILNPMYFLTFHEENQNFEHKHECFVRADYLFTENRWDMIFKNALEINVEKFQDIWCRLPELSNFSKFWQYELLACVSLVDKYSKSFSQASDDKIPRGKFKKIKSDLKKFVEEATDQDTFSRKELNVINSIIEQVQYIKNTKYPNFESCFTYTYEKMGQPVRDIINLSPEDFKHIKQLRDKVAHGELPKTKLQGNITYEMMLQNKLLVILYFWALQDFGISEKDIIKFLGNWMHPMIRAARLNKTAIDREISPHKFLPVNKKDFTKITRGGRKTIILENKGNNKNYKYRHDYNQLIENWYDTTHKDTTVPASLDEYLTLHVDPNEINSLCYSSSIYVENAEESHCAFGTCILNPPTHLSDPKRLWKYDVNLSRWYQPATEKE
ncbi:HEPN domain-containing protein [Curvivirga sp.]|uniref:HEPN domain-containing protein n=1 Tax=Curvivirga sp. TaxID=2856848 RepID=UPI003B5B10C1